MLSYKWGNNILFRSSLGRSLSSGLCNLGHRSVGALLGATCALSLLLSLSHVLVEVHQLDKAHRSVIVGTETGLDDAGVATGTVGHLLRNNLEQLCYGKLVLQIAEDNAAAVRSILLALIC